jgi:signal transduction histidine kinase
MMKATATTIRPAWLATSPWWLLLAGPLVALLIVTVAMSVLLRPPMRELATLVGALAGTSVFSLAAGYLLYRKGWPRSPSISLTLALTFVWAAVLTLFNVWVLATAMFVDTHDLTLAGILLVFAAIIATSFGMFVSATVTDELRRLAQAAGDLAAGDLSARAHVGGRDEVAQVAVAFNAMAAQLEAAAARRAEYETLRRDLIAWTSHDLRTPLTSIRAMIEALNDGLVPDEATRERYYRTIRAEVVALNTLIDDLFELAQLDAGGLILEFEMHSLSDLISDTLESFLPLAQQREVTLAGEVTAGLDPVRMNAPRIGRVLGNLLANALRHTPAGGSIRLEAWRTGGAVRVAVSDSGPGFAAGELPRVFEKFYRGEGARSRATGGAGLGLAIASGIVEAHGGRIWAENAGPGGARVSFELPDLPAGPAREKAGYISSR